MTQSENPRVARFKALARPLEIAAPVLAILALLYRATLYWTLPGGASGEPGTAQLLDLGLALLLFLVGLLCAGAGVAISLFGGQADKGRAYRAFFLGAGSFMLYEFIYPHVPRLM